MTGGNCVYLVKSWDSRLMVRSRDKSITKLYNIGTVIIFIVYGLRHIVMCVFFVPINCRTWFPHVSLKANVCLKLVKKKKVVEKLIDRI